MTDPEIKFGHINDRLNQPLPTDDTTTDVAPHPDYIPAAISVDNPEDPHPDADMDAVNRILGSDPSQAPHAAAPRHSSYRGPTKNFNPQAFAPNQQRSGASPAHTGAVASGPISIGDMLREAGKNALPDAGQVLGGVADSIVHLPRTVQTLGQLGAGAVSQASGYLPFIHQDPAQKKKNEALIKAFEQNYADHYGSVDRAMRSFATSPVSTAMDASMLVPGLDLVAAGADSVKAATVARGLRAASKTLDAANPVTVAGNVAKGIVRAVPGRTVSSALSSVPKRAYSMADDAMKTPEGAAGYRDFMSGAADDRTVQQHAVQAVNDYANAKKAAHATAMSDLAANAGPVGFDGLKADLAEMRKNVPGGLKAESVNKDLDAIQSHLDGGSYSPDVQGLDRLRGDLYDAYPGNDDHIGQVRDLIKNKIEEAAPGYKAQLASYAPDQKLIAEMRQELGAGRRSAADTLSTLTRNIGRGRTTFLDDAVSKNPYLGGMLAASHFKPIMNPSHGNLIGAVLGGHAGLLGSVAGAFGQKIAGSPRLHGALNNALAAAPGRISPLAKAAASTEKIAADANAALPPENVEGPAPPDVPAGAPLANADLFVKNWWMPHEGEWNPNDANGTPSAWGINGGANPDLDVSKLRGDPQAAADIIKKRVWGNSGADNMPLPLALVHADTYGNSGPEVAKAMLEESKGDPNKYLQLKRNLYDRLLKRDPNKYGKYAHAWVTRADDMQAVFDAMGLGNVATAHARGGVAAGVGDDAISEQGGDAAVGYGRENKNPDQGQHYSEGAGNKPQNWPSPHDEGQNGDYRKENVHNGLPLGGGNIRGSTKMSTAERQEYHVRKLMARAKAAKKEADSGTEPLLNAPDDAIVKALHVAQEAI